MSTRPHTVLSCALRRARLPLFPFRRGHCRSGLASPGDGTFRVDANGTLPDRWFLVACVSCDRTSAIAVHDRVPVRYPDAIPLDGYSRTSSALVARLRLDPSRQERHPAEPRNSPVLLVRPAVSRRGPEPGREARWPCPGLRHAAVRARSFMTGRERRSGPARYGRRR
ncbi:DUF1062 domain-containing protein [Micromonospora sp. I033]